MKPIRPLGHVSFSGSGNSFNTNQASGPYHSFPFHALVLLFHKQQNQYIACLYHFNPTKTRPKKKPRIKINLPKSPHSCPIISSYPPNPTTNKQQAHSHPSSPILHTHLNPIYPAPVPYQYIIAFFPKQKPRTASRGHSFSPDSQ